MGQPDKPFERLEPPTSSTWLQLFEFILANKKWWLVPLVIVLALLGVLVFISSTPLAPFIYPLF